MVSNTGNVCKSSIEVKRMTTKRKKKTTYAGGRIVTVAFSLCLLAVVAMIGMYTVGRSDQQEEELEQQVAEAQEQARAQEEAQQLAEEQAEEERQQAASAAAQRQMENDLEDEIASGEKTADGAELESEFAVEEVAEAIVVEEVQETASEAVAEQKSYSFSPETDTLLWPIAGNIILDYSMDKSVYFATLDQYKYNPAVIIQGTVDASVLCGADGKIASIETVEETGTTVTVDIGNGYELIYGQLKELTVKEGDSVSEGKTIGYVSEPTRYYSKEGCNVYFEVRKDGTSIDPMSLLQ